MILFACAESQQPEWFSPSYPSSCPQLLASHVWSHVYLYEGMVLSSRNKSRAVQLGISQLLGLWPLASVRRWTQRLLAHFPFITKCFSRKTTFPNKCYGTCSQLIWMQLRLKFDAYYKPSTISTQPSGLLSLGIKNSPASLCLFFLLLPLHSVFFSFHFLKP